MRTIRIVIKGREFELTPEQADRIARRMAAHEPDGAAWGETAMLLLDFARTFEDES